ncbi:MAG: hypothetical protein LBR10_06525 [Prevotellaceae bacterium]|jgi:hypothetical protein|nr:hypothetical protein [Prevotellaceae bacterium]
MDKTMIDVVVTVGGTGTQVGTLIGLLYPVLNRQKPFQMFILDKDTTSGIYTACVDANEKYKHYDGLLPIPGAPAKNYTLDPSVYQNLQKFVDFAKNPNYTVMHLIGNDKSIKDMAAMCWTEDKRIEPMHDGNNRDPSRGSLDVYACLEHLKDSSFYKEIKKLNDDKHKVRIVIVGGITGGMGTSLIIPLLEKLNMKESDDSQQTGIAIDIDLVLLGPYFGIPANDVNVIGTNREAYFRAAAQLEELASTLKQDSKNVKRVYYAAMPQFDIDTCGEFKINGAGPRKFHLIELCAALACFDLDEKADGFYQTVFPDSLIIDWAEIPLGEDIEKNAKNLMRLISVLAFGLRADLDDFCEGRKNRQVFLKKYIAKYSMYGKTIGNMRGLLKLWLQTLGSFVDIWIQIKEYTRFGETNKKEFVRFFDKDELQKIRRCIDEPNYRNDWPMLPDKQLTWNNIVYATSPYAKRNEVGIADGPDAKEILAEMIKDIFNKIEEFNK